MKGTRKNPTIEKTNDELGVECAKDCIELSDVAEVLDGDTKDPHVTLIPLQRVGDTIKCKVQCKGISKPFFKARSILTSE